MSIVGGKSIEHNASIIGTNCSNINKTYDYRKSTKLHGCKLLRISPIFQLREQNINGYLHIPSNSLIPNHRDLGDGYFAQLPCRTDSYKFSFFPSTIKLWNSLPLFIINSPSYPYSVL